jgi:hypothetical protein
MKTGKYTTTKKSKTKKKPPINLTSAEVAEISGLASQYISQWTKTELQKLQQLPTPVCIPISNGYIIGKYTVRRMPTQQWEVADNHNDILHTFYHKLGAVFYAIYQSKNQLGAAQDLLAYDREFTKHDNDIRVYKYTIDRAKLQKDYFTVDRVTARMEISLKKREFAEDNLTKTFNRAKYYKIWDSPK